MRKVDIPEVNIVETRTVTFNEPLVILGFAGVGLVGGIAATHIIEKLKMQQIAHVQSRYMPPAVVFMDGKLRHPFRIYSDDGGKLCVVVSEIPLRSDGVYPIASTLVDWIEGNGAKELVVLEGVAVQGLLKERKSYCAAEPEKIKECKEKGVEIISAGIIQGIAGSILNECLSRDITGVALLVPAMPFMPDPEGAALLIDTLDRVYDLKIDAGELLRKTGEIRQKLKEVADRHQKLRKAEEKSGLPDNIYV